ncbi:hypothetical protein GCM10023187_07250 [Nibrella viscosa]|uniref:PNPLA domain-containing protein n=1 Tax=Nibrella viscosa TaxID=1084524 RepID=A0ABP8JXT5_9BACT
MKPHSPGTPYFILSLDGGGSWALNQILALQQLFGPQVRGHAVLRQFDLVVANSGGSITAMALAKNMPLSEILNWFVTPEKLRKVFVRVDPFRRLLHKVSGATPQYVAARKLEGLRALWQEDLAKHWFAGQPATADELPVTLNDLHRLFPVAGPATRKPHFLITTYDYDRDRATFFRSATDSAAQTHVIADLVSKSTQSKQDIVSIPEAVHASSNAPIKYFDKPAIVSVKHEKSSAVREHRYWDGAVGAYNNPVMAGLVEALCNGVPLSDMRVLSIGTGNEFLPLADPTAPGPPSPYCKKSEIPGPINDIEKISTSILNDPPDAASFTAYTLLHQQFPVRPENLRLVRMNPLIQPKLRKSGTRQEWVLPTLNLTDEEFSKLVELELDTTDPQDILLVKKFGELWTQNEIPNQPIRADAELQCLLGHPTFAEARKAWQTLQPPGHGPA